MELIIFAVIRDPQLFSKLDTMLEPRTTPLFSVFLPNQYHQHGMIHMRIRHSLSHQILNTYKLLELVLSILITECH